MKSIVIFLSLLVALALMLVSVCNKRMDARVIQYVPTPGETMVIVSPNCDVGPLKHFMEIFPKEIYLGDTIYLVAYDENVSSETVECVLDYSNLPMYEYYAEQFTLTTTAIFKKYNWKPERPGRWSGSYGASARDLQPAEKRSHRKTYLEFPPLEDLREPFWKELSTDIPKDGVICKLRIKYEYSGLLQEEKSFTTPEGSVITPHATHTMEVEQEILIKPRPASEMALLEKWYRSTPKKLFPESVDGCKIPHNMDLRSSGRSNITVGWWAYDPWLFIRLGNRKPSDPNNPQTLDGWRKLEASLTPSTMRDEVRLTRLQLEFYSAQKGEASEKAKSELAAWLKSLPEVQRVVMTTFLVSKMYDFHRTSLRDKNRELMRAIYDLLDHGCQEAVVNFESRNYRDRTLPPPAGVRVQRSLEEILEPTTEDLAHGTKELPDGFRIWEVIVEKKPVKQVGQFVELKEDEDRMIVKLRDGGNFPWEWIFSMLSEEDQQYAREQSRKAANGE